MNIPIELIYILTACFIITLLALIGLLSLFFAQELIENAIISLVSFAAGTLIGAAFFHLLPESIERGGPVFVMVVVGIVVLFALEIFLYVYHHHFADSDLGHGERKGVKPVGVLSLFSDSIHNVTDGIIIASSFLVSIELGIVTSIVAALHEIPQEFGDYAILIHSGYSRVKALIFNYLAALTIFIGAVGFYIFSEQIENLTIYSVPFAAGAFIYIALAALMPEIKEERASLGRKTFQFSMLIFGIVLLWFLKIWFG